MTKGDQLKIVKQINDYADKVLPEKDPYKVPIRVQLETLKPEMEKIGKDHNMTLEDIFIMYMDLNSELTVAAQKDLDLTLES